VDEGYPKISKESASLCRIVNDGINRVSEDEHYKAIRLDVIQSKYVIRGISWFPSSYYSI